MHPERFLAPHHDIPAPSSDIPSADLSKERGWSARPLVKGVAVDCDPDASGNGTKYREDAFWLERTEDGGHLLTVSIADASSMVWKDSLVDKHAQRRRTSLPRAFRKQLSLCTDEERPTISVTLPISGDYEIGEPQITRTRVSLAGGANLAPKGVNKILVNPTHHLSSFFQECATVAVNLRNKRPDEWIRTSSISATCKHIPANIAEDIYETEKGTFGLSSFSARELPDLIVAEFMIAANKGVGSYFAENNIPAIYRGKNEAWVGPQYYTPFPDIHSNFRTPYAYITSPMRRYEALVNQRILSALADGKPMPYSLRQLNAICFRLNMHHLDGTELRTVYGQRDVQEWRVLKKHKQKGNQKPRTGRIFNPDAAPYGRPLPPAEPKRSRTRERKVSPNGAPKTTYGFNRLWLVPREQDGLENVVTPDRLVSLGLVPPEVLDRGIRIIYGKDKPRHPLVIKGLAVTGRAEKHLRQRGVVFTDKQAHPRAEVLQRVAETRVQNKQFRRKG